MAFLVALADESKAAEGRAAEARAERRLAERLAAIRDEFNIHFDHRRRTADVSSALRDYGVDIATLGPAEAGRRVAASLHADEVVDELDESILWQRRSKDVEGERRFLAVAEAADRAPWRREVRHRDRTGRRHGADETFRRARLRQGHGARNPQPRRRPDRKGRVPPRWSCSRPSSGGTPTTTGSTSTWPSA